LIKYRTDRVDAWLSTIFPFFTTRRKESRMTDQIMKAARDLGIESKVHVVEDQQLNPLVRIVEGTRIVHAHVDARWFLDTSPQNLKSILSDLHRMARNN
jgi:hypothetical protein